MLGSVKTRGNQAGGARLYSPTSGIGLSAGSSHPTPIARAPNLAEGPSAEYLFDSRISPEKHRLAVSMGRTSNWRDAHVDA